MSDAWSVSRDIWGRPIKRVPGQGETRPDLGMSVHAWKCDSLPCICDGYEVCVRWWYPQPGEGGAEMRNTGSSPALPAFSATSEKEAREIAGAIRALLREIPLNGEDALKAALREFGTRRGFVARNHNVWGTPSPRGASHG